MLHNGTRVFADLGCNQINLCGCTICTTLLINNHEKVNCIVRGRLPFKLGGPCAATHRKRIRIWSENEPICHIRCGLCIIEYNCSGISENVLRNTECLDTNLEFLGHGNFNDLPCSRQSGNSARHGGVACIDLKIPGHQKRKSRNLCVSSHSQNVKRIEVTDTQTLAVLADPFTI